MSHAYDLALRPGWYPDPDGEYCYRKHDGSSWSSETAPVPAARRSAFLQQQRAMARRTGATPTSGRAQQRGNLRVAGATATATRHEAIDDPGRGLGIAAFWVGLLVSTVISLILAHCSRKASNRVGLPRNGWARAAIALTLARLVVLCIFIEVFAVAFMGTSNDSFDGKPAHKRAVTSTVNAVETCAATRPDGSYGPCATGRNPDLAGLGVKTCTAAITAGSTCVAPLGANGFAVKTKSEQNVTFVERHGADGSITRSCAPAGAGCADGTW